MVSAPSTFERVYLGLKTWLTSGRFHPGERLEPNHLSDELNSSVTPVRDALHRLTGERMVEAPRSEGFRVPLVSEFMLRHLYGWHRDLLLLALSRRGEIVSSLPGEDADPQPARIAREHALFIAIASASGNLEHAHALRSLLYRLEPFQRLEDQFLSEIEEEVSAIAQAVERSDRRELRALLVRYHRRRARIIPDLVAITSGR